MNLSIVTLLLKILHGVATYLNNRELMTAGEMRAINAMQEKVLKRVEKAKQIRNASRNKSVTRQLLQKPEERNK